MQRSVSEGSCRRPALWVGAHRPEAVKTRGNPRFRPARISARSFGAGLTLTNTIGEKAALNGFSLAVRPKCVKSPDPIGQGSDLPQANAPYEKEVIWLIDCSAWASWLALSGEAGNRCHYAFGYSGPSAGAPIKDLRDANLIGRPKSVSASTVAGRGHELSTGSTTSPERPMSISV